MHVSYPFVVRLRDKTSFDDNSSTTYRHRLRWTMLFCVLYSPLYECRLLTHLTFAFCGGQTAGRIRIGGEAIGLVCQPDAWAVGSKGHEGIENLTTCAVRNRSLCVWTSPGGVSRAGVGGEAASGG